MMMPEQVRSAFAQCERAINPKGQRRCSETERLYPSSDVIAKWKYTVDFKRFMVEMECEKVGLTMIDTPNFMTKLEVGGLMLLMMIWLKSE
ncbi:hypothetical protein TNCV_1281411 [Trichonephila clavipes]|nr:hypothetical protein TNCV_1281411 [Trichonephila clavipes]